MAAAGYDASNHSAGPAPVDEYDRRLLSNTRPTAWVNPTPAGRYNLVVIGAGTAGLVAAAGAAALGAKVAIVERGRMGGDCLNVGCVPSKTLLRSARAAAEVRDARRFGVWLPEGVSVDFAAVMERLRRVRAEISLHDSVERFTALGVDVFLGRAEFAARDRVAVGGVELRFARACIATGSRPAKPNVPGLEAGGYLTNETVFELRELPRRMAVFGGGPNGCEMAQTFARLGSEVTLLTTDSGVLPKDDPEASEVVRRALEADGVRVDPRGREARVERSGDAYRLTLGEGGEQASIEVDAVLVAVGRRANVEGLGLEEAGIKTDEGGVRVNDFLQTSNPDVYASGDVCTLLKFTHAADAMSRIVAQNALAFGRRRFSSLTIPWCTYTDPESAQVGVDPRSDADGRFESFRVELPGVDRGATEGDRDGFCKVRVRRGTDRIVGASVVGPGAGELISQLTLAIETGAGLKTLAAMIYPYPTRAEALKKAADAYNRTRLTPSVRTLSRALMRWRR